MARHSRFAARSVTLIISVVTDERRRHQRQGAARSILMGGKQGFFGNCVRAAGG
jgi:hypothetical protein